MDWIKSYRLCNDMDKSISSFIENCDEIRYTRNKEDIIRNRREARISYLFNQEVKDDLEYINYFLNDFHDKIKFTEMPVAQYSYLDFSFESSPLTSLKSMNMAVSSYQFVSYSDLKLFLNSRLLLNEEIYVFNYRVYDDPENRGSKVYHLRCFFITDDLKNNSFGLDNEKQNIEYELGKIRRPATDGF